MRRLRVCLATMPWQPLESPSLAIGLLRAACRGAGRDTPVTYHGNLRWAEFLLERTGGDITPPDHAYLAESTVDVTDAFETRRYADEFVDLAAREILAREPDVVGLTSTFAQNGPSLAVAARIKRYRPGVRTVLGGGNCDGPAGAALHRGHSYVDYVVRGEGEDALPALLDAIEHDQPPAALPGVCWWRDGTSVANPQPRHPLPPGRVPVPDFDDWFARFESSPVARYVEPRLTLGSSRGCWWGEPDQCAFCGSVNRLRDKPAQRTVDQLSTLVERHKVLDVVLVDTRHHTEPPPALAGLDWDLRIHYETEANLRPEHVAALRAGHVYHVRPGIDSLTVHNVWKLRDCESAHLTATWYWRFGRPGGTPEHHLAQLPALVHLQPPRGPDPLGPEWLDDELRQAVADWTKAYADSSLVRTDNGRSIGIEDRRGGWPDRDHHITDPVLVAAYRELEPGRSPAALCRRVADAGLDLPLERATAWLAELAAAGLVFHDGDRYVALATSSVPTKVRP